ncbi:MAG: 3-hydroxybutyryl-CoA dehydrogenase [Holophagaceae bacterium]|nr:3-hydroxybutyryl-CoA dehydrogenase [Holophagaceae bacterium]
MTEGPLAILGPGTLGLSLAQWAAECGLETRLLGRDQDHAEAGRLIIQRRWDQAVAKGRLSPEARWEVEARLTGRVFAREALEGVSAFLEALPEDPAAKTPALATAARWGAPELLLLSGTSSLRISSLALAAGLPDRLVGFHLFVPVPRMAVVEMGVAPGTPERLVARTRALGQALRKRVVQVRDQPGFAAARMALAQGLEAMRLLEDGVASAEDLDALMTLGYGHPVGPLELSDRIGLDLRLRIAEGLADAGEERFRPPGILVSKAAEGSLGLKRGSGFFPWDPQGRRS